MILFRTIHKDYFSTWFDYRNSKSFKHGARWNLPNIPATYTSSNAQNAMLECANYTPSPKAANRLYRLCVFEVPELRLKNIEPTDLPDKWFQKSSQTQTQELGSKYLLNPDYEGIVVPSVTINHGIATHPINAIRHSVWANVVINLDTIGIDRIKLIEVCEPLFSTRMFGA
ncbi:RES family NAD+ phosphorylase [Alteromonas sp. 14N.309.X.WAT.G.H12]|uniref:RES family NAD+ phosphorylase n=1 Tax=Alteromonas sp. 14N.309.X.WAT.G.H12 TaxID=3120824 RepID=UPI002FD2A248